MIKKFILLAAIFLCSMVSIMAQTTIPNPGFENWTTTGNYTNPTGWDTPNEELMAIPFFGFPVVTKSTDHQGSGSFSAKLETKHLAIPPMDIPGFMTCGNIVVDITAGTYILSGGVPVVDQPTHLKGYFKFFPKGGDSCVIGIGLTRNVSGVQDTIGYGYFSTKDTVSDWTPFSAWILYESTDQADTMNIIVMSTAQEIMTPGTILYVDNFFLDYTVDVKGNKENETVKVYNDRETGRLLIFRETTGNEDVSVRLFNMQGSVCVQLSQAPWTSDRKIVDYRNLPAGIYLLEVLHGNRRFLQRYALNLNHR